MKKLSACFIMTDAISFNGLCQGQLEYFNEHGGMELTLICGGSPDQIEYLKSRNVGRVIYLPLVRKPSPLKDVESLFKLVSYLVTHRFDIIVYSTPKALLLGSIASFLTFQKNRVAIVQGRVYENYNGFKKKVFQAFDKISFLVSNDVLFVSKSLSENCIEENLIDSQKAKVIGNGSFNGVNVDYFKPIEPEDKLRLRNKLGLGYEDFIVSVVGRICLDKGIEDISKVIESVTRKNIKFLFVGSFEDAISEKTVRGLVNNGKAYYIPHSSKVFEIFQASDLHLFLSHREGFGNVSIEAASCGVPTFAYDVVGVKDSVNEGVTGKRFNFRDFKSVSKAIESAAIDLNFQDKYNQARTWAVENFEQKKVWKDYLNFYLKKIKDKPYD